ncbi:hypothetical protein BG015_009157 [Linnemannia schmuckeri]|uniref:Uncharacterized protein n=1 Tax=Linnemannia schmuckeri TaxID=64567 RepID=A0A9P5RVX9_9FUNG|nr:hypothetical protein BG015_009157 [Linnemannia schmuckeri]
MSTASGGRNNARMEDPAQFPFELQTWFLKMAHEEQPKYLYKWYIQEKELNDLKKQNDTLGKVLYSKDREIEHTKQILDNKKAYDRGMNHLEESLAFVPASPEGGPIEGRLLTLINSLIKNEADTKKKDADITKKDVEIKHLKAELDRYKKGGEGSRRPSMLMASSLDEGENKDTVKLQAELEITKNDLSEMEKVLQAREQEVIRLTEERDTARANMEEAQSKAEDLDRDVTRAHKAKISAQDSKYKLEAEIKNLEAQLKKKESEIKHMEVRLNSRDSDYKLDRIEVGRLKKELESQKKSYEKTKTLSTLDDVKKIKALNQKLEGATERIETLEKDVKEKEALLEANRSKIQKVDDEKNEVLQRLGHLQEELGKKDLELSGMRLKVGGLESATRLVEKERDAESRKTKQGLEMVQHELAIARKRISEREKDIEFWRASIANQEKKAEEQATQIQNDTKTIKEISALMEIMRTNQAKVQGEVLTLQSSLQSYKTSTQDQERTIKLQQDELDDLRRKISESEIRAVDQAQLQQAMDTLRIKVEALAVDPTETQGHIVLKTEHSDAHPKSIDEISENAQSSSRNSISNGNVWSELVRVAKELVAVTATVQDVRSSVPRGLDNKSGGQDGAKITELESKLQEQAVTHQRVKQELEMLQDETRKEVERLEELISEQNEQLQELVEIRSMFGPGEEGTERQVEYTRACARIEAVEDMVAEWEAAIETANKNHDYMLRICEEQAQHILQLQNQRMDVEEKVARVERDLERCRSDLKSVTADLVKCKVDAKENESKANELDMELQSCKHRVNQLEQELADQGQQLDGQTRAHKALETARRTYNKVYESKIKRLQEDKTTLEVLFNAELLKRDEAHHRELVKAKGDREVGLGLSQAEVIAIKAECEGLKAKLEVEEEEKLKMNGMIISYAELVKVMQDDGKIMEETLPLVEVLSQVQEYLSTIESLRSDISVLTENNEGLNQLVKEYQDDTTTLTNRTESYLGHIRLLEAQVYKLRQNLAQNETTMRFLHSRTQQLERDLKEQMDTTPRPGGMAVSPTSEAERDL